MASESKPSDQFKSSQGRVSAKTTADPVLRNALRYTISAKEYETLHKYIISRSSSLRKTAPSVARVERLIERPGRDDYNAAALRATVRVFVATSTGLKIWAVISERLLGREKSESRRPIWRSTNLRLSLSLSTILLFHRILYRFFSRLRAHLLTDEAKPFRQRNRRTSRTLTSNLAPAIGASLAGFLLAVYPKDQLRLTAAIYALSRAAEITYNHAENEGWIWGKRGSRWERPWWWGSWMILPLACGQLLHAFVYDRDCFPKEFGDSILQNSPQYIQSRPKAYPLGLSWPNTYEIVDNLAEMGRLKYPPFISPILFPNTTTLPKTLEGISPITSPAHPLITSLTCATLHPSDPSCLRTYLTYWIRAFPRLARFFTILFIFFSIPKYKQFYQSPLHNLGKLASGVLKYSVFITGSIGTAWGAICLFQQLLPKHALATQRFFLGGALGGLWALVVRKDARGEFLYSFRLSVDSLWKVGKKRGWWKGIKGGDVWLFVAGLMVVNVIYERDARALKSSLLRRILSSCRGEGFGDWVSKEDERIDEEKKRL